MHAMTDLRRARGAIAAAFFTQGLVFISLTTRLPRIQDRWDLGELALSGVLLMMVLLAGAGSLLAERLAPRLDSARVLRAGLLLIAVTVPVALLAPSIGVFVVGLAAYGVGLGIVDATGNMQAVALEHRLGRVVLPSCHGAWTLGGVIAAVLTLATVDLPWSATALIAVLPLAGGVRALPGPRPRRGRDHDGDRRAVAGDHDGRPGPRRLLHRRHGRHDLGTGLPRRRLRRPRGARRAGHAALPRGQRSGAPGRRRAHGAGREPSACCASVPGSRSWRWRSSLRRRRGRWPWSASPCWAAGWRWWPH